MKRVIVAGGGASGMMAAITAARNGAAVTILEGMDRAGKKILLTGNGRCNLTHADDVPEQSCFGADQDFLRTVFRRFTYQDVKQFFEELGMLTYDRGGYIYPVTGQASTVTELLLAEIRRLKIKLKLSEKILKLEKENGIWKLYTSSWCYEADSVILACGSKAAEKTGSDGSGYTLARMTGHKLIPVFPALTSLICEGKYYAQTAGTRSRAEVTLYETHSDGRKNKVRTEQGELQWTAYGVSGIMIFQISRFFSDPLLKKHHYSAELNLLPDLAEEKYDRFSGMAALRDPQQKVSALLCGILPEKLIPAVLNEAGIPLKMTAEKLMADSRMKHQLKDTLYHFPLKVTGTKGFDVCQVCGGGVDTAQIDPESMESRIQSSLYFAGEILNVDGMCGGYNLQWAWSSGYVAGLAAAQQR